MNQVEDFRELLRAKSDEELLRLLDKAAKNGLKQTTSVRASETPLREKMRYMIELTLEMFNNHNEEDERERRRLLDMENQSFAEFRAMMSPEQRRVVPRYESPSQPSVGLQRIQDLMNGNDYDESPDNNRNAPDRRNHHDSFHNDVVSFQVGDRVEASCWGQRGPKNIFYPGKIIEINPDGTYKVKYDSDGKIGQKVKAIYIRRISEDE